MGERLIIALGADHGGVALKDQLRAYLSDCGHVVRDVGTHGPAAVDYPRYAKAVAELVASGACRFGILVDGAGIGSAIAANKVPGVRAAACYNEGLARNSREHNDANVLVLGAAHSSFEVARSMVDIFLSSQCTAPRHLARVALIREIEAAYMSTQPSAPAEAVSSDDIARIVARVRQLLVEGTARAGRASLSPREVAQLIDHTLLRPEATPADIARLCDEAARYGFYSVCVNPSYVAQARALLRNTAVKVCCVVGFPLGAQPPEIKALEARRAIREGAQEIDMVINIGALRSGDTALVLRDIRAVVEACRDGRARCKVILETALLSDEEKQRACELSMKAGADFVKTSTGFSSAGATVEDVRLMSRVVAPRKLGVKASGGVRTYDDLLRMVEAGATRIGTSSSVRIMEEAKARAGSKE